MSVSIADLRAGDPVAYDGRQWTVTDHTQYTHPAWPAAEWRLERGGETRLLEHDTTHGRDRLRLFRSVEIADLAPLDPAALEEASIEAELPGRLTYQGNEFGLAERDARIDPRASFSCSLRTRKVLGVFGGMAEHLNLSPGLFRLFASLPFLNPALLIPGIPLYFLAGYSLPDPIPGWRIYSYDRPYRHCAYTNDEQVLVLAYVYPDAWTAYAGQEVSPSAFDLGTDGDGASIPAEQRIQTIGPPFVGETGAAADRPVADLSLKDLRAGDLVEYDMQTWMVTRHAVVPAEGWPTAEWRLAQDDRRLFLEQEDDGRSFRAFTPIDLADVTVGGTPFLAAVPIPTFIDGTLTKHVSEDAPVSVEYNGREYTLTSEDDRRPINAQVQSAHDTHRCARSHVNRSVLGIFGGMAEYAGVNLGDSLFRSVLVRGIGAGILLLLLVEGVRRALRYAIFALFGVQGGGASLFIAMLMALTLFVVLYVGIGLLLPGASRPREERLSHHWVYEADDRFLVLECLGTRDWHAYVGGEVGPHEFANILPQGSA